MSERTIKDWVWWLIGVLALIGISILAVVNAKKFGDGELVAKVNEYVYLKQQGYKRKDGVISNKDDEIVVPEEFADNNVTGIGVTPDTSTSGTTVHTPTNRKDATPISNSAKDKLKG